MTSPATRPTSRRDLLARLAVAAILAQTLFFKFTWAPETQWIFETKLGVGRAGATLAGLVELAAVVLLLVPRTAALGALVALGTMVGALGSHLTALGVEVQSPTTGEGDGGTLFVMALVVAVLSAWVAARRRTELPLIGPRLASQGRRDAPAR